MAGPGKVYLKCAWRLMLIGVIEQHTEGYKPSMMALLLLELIGLPALFALRRILAPRGVRAPSPAAG